VVIDSFSSPVSEQASVFLALATNIERNGVMADAEGSLALLKQAEAPKGDSREGWQILTALGRAAGASAKFGGDTAEDCWAHARALLAPGSAATLADLELEGSSNVAHFATRQHASQARNRSKLYNPGSYRTDGLRLRNRIQNLELPAPRSSSISRSSDLVLTWGPHISGRGYFADRAVIANVLLPKPFAELHPADAAELGLKGGQFAILHVQGAKAKVAIKISKGPARGTVYLSGGTYGPFDASSLAGSLPVRLEGLAESAPDQGAELVAGAAGRGQE
jgi:assimilatory nitrate reductase catalytic subunit